MLTDLIQAVATVVLVVVTVFYTFYTKSLAQMGKEPILDLKNHPSVLNIRCDLEIENLSDFFAKDIVIMIKRKDKTDINCCGPKVLYPHKVGVYKAIENPFFKSFVAGDKIILDCKSISGKKTKFEYIYEDKKIDMDKEIPAEFSLNNVTQNNL
jgi:hypothetical protein